MRETTKVVAIDPENGRHLRDATADECAAYYAQPCTHPVFRKPVRVGAVLVDEYFGPGVWLEQGVSD